MLRASVQNFVVTALWCRGCVHPWITRRHATEHDHISAYLFSALFRLFAVFPAS